MTFKRNLMISAITVFCALLIFILATKNNDAGSDCAETNEGMKTMNQEMILFLNDQGETTEFNSFIADDNQERAMGYQYICQSIIEKTTILFVFAKPISSQFHMNNVRSPLDIGFFDDNGLLITVLKMDTYDDGNHRLYHPDRPFQFALEAKPGFFREHNFSSGTTRLLLNSLYDHQ